MCATKNAQSSPATLEENVKIVSQVKCKNGIKCQQMFSKNIDQHS